MTTPAQRHMISSATPHLAFLLRSVIVFFCDYPATSIGPETPAAARPPIRRQLIEQCVSIVKSAIDVHCKLATLNLFQYGLCELQILTHTGNGSLAGGQRSHTDRWRGEFDLLLFWQWSRSCYQEQGEATGHVSRRDAATVVHRHGELPLLVRY